MKNDKIPTGTLLVFSKTKLFLLFFTSMMIGTAFFFFGFFMGYNIGQDTLIKKIQTQMKQKQITDANLQTKLKLNPNDLNNKDKIKNNYHYIVHIGLFNSAEYAQKAWLEVSDYAKLEENKAIQTITINEQTFFKVILGEFSNKEFAQTFAKMITERTNKQLAPVIEKVSPNKKALPQTDNADKGNNPKKNKSI